jgi:hypothetical protein
MRIALIHIFFGELPPWWELYVKTVKNNPEIDFIYVTDISLPNSNSTNIKIIKWSLMEFCASASKTLGFEVKLKSFHKISDLKPVYGSILSEFLEPYEFWGHADIDQVYGQIGIFLNKQILKKNDVISCRKEITAGQFTLYRNSPIATNIWKNIPGLKTLIDHEQTQHVDEVAQSKEVKSSSRMGLITCHLVEKLTDDKLAWQRGRYYLFLKLEHGRIWDCITGEEKFMFHFLKAKKSALFFEEFKKIDFQNQAPIYFLENRFFQLSYFQYLYTIIHVLVKDFRWVLKRFIKVHFLRHDPNFI